MVDVVNNCFIFLLLGMYELDHAYCLSSIIELIEEFMLHLIPTINALSSRYVSIKSVLIEGTNKFFDKEVTLHDCITASFNEVDNMLL